MSDSHTDTLISCLCVICAIHLSTSNRTSWGNATGVPRQKKFTSKASSWYYYSLVYFLTTPYCYQHSASFSYRAGTKHWIKPDNKVATKICNKLQLFSRLTTITGFTSLVSCKRSSPRKRVAGITTHLSTFLPHLIVINTLHPFRIELVQNIELCQIIRLPQKYGTNYSYFQGLPLLQVSPP